MSYYVTRGLNMEYSTRKNSTKQLSMNVYQWLRENWDVPRKDVRAIVKQT